MTSLTRQAQQILSSHLSKGDVVIDATAGNGYDTLFLAEHVGSTGKVFAFDIQPQAIAKTRQKLSEHNELEQVTLLEHGHEQLLSLIPVELQQKITMVMFNLGYLPGSDKTCITREQTTMPALEQALQLLKQGGLLSIMLYPGHAGGDSEAESVKQWVYNLTEVKLLNSVETKGPHWLLIRKEK